MSLNLNRRLIIKWLRDPASQRPETAMFLERAAELLEGGAQYLPQQTDAVLAEREACAKVVEGVELTPFSFAHDALRAAAARVRSRPSPGPATETERKDGWWVTPEWEEHPDGTLQLYVLGIFSGDVMNRDDGWRAYRPPDGIIVRGLPTREEAQAALLASVRPKAEGV